jgi:hypothetical protein
MRISIGYQEALKQGMAMTAGDDLLFAIANPITQTLLHVLAKSINHGRKALRQKGYVMLRVEDDFIRPWCIQVE